MGIYRFCTCEHMYSILSFNVLFAADEKPKSHSVISL